MNINIDLLEIALWLIIFAMVFSLIDRLFFFGKRIKKDHDEKEDISDDE